MDRKTWLGFLAGIVLAGGASYVWTHRSPAPTPVIAPPVEQKAVEAQSTAPPVVQTAPPPVVKATAKKPLPAPIARVVKEAPPEAPIETAAIQPAPPPAPVPAPIEDRPIELAPAPVPVTVPTPKPPAPHTVTIPSGAVLDVRVLETLSSSRNVAGDTFMITLDQALVVDGFVLAERGAQGEGRVVDVKGTGRVHGLPSMLLELTHISTSDGQNISIHTACVERTGTESTKAEVAKVGAGTVLGTVIGAAAGGGKGAAIGAAAGAAAGVGTVMATRGKPAEVRSESRLSFRLEEPVSLTEKLGR